MTFTNLPSTIAAMEAEEIGVEHLLRDVKDTTTSNLSSSVQERLAALKALHTRFDFYFYYVIIKKEKKNIN